jgi:hypothetical protein
MNLLDAFPAKARVVITALPTYLAAFITILTVMSTELVPLLPDAWAAKVAGYIAVSLLWVTGAITTIRRLTPADSSQFGLLPAPNGMRYEGPGMPLDRDQGHAKSGVLQTLVLIAVLMLIIFIVFRVL